MPAAEFPPDVAGLLGRLRERLAARADVVGVYVYGSLVTGDYSPAASDIDAVVLVQRDPDEAMTRELTELHTALARGRAVRAMAAAGHQAGPACRMKFSGQTMEFRTRQ